MFKGNVQDVKELESRHQGGKRRLSYCCQGEEVGQKGGLRLKSAQETSMWKHRAGL